MSEAKKNPPTQISKTVPEGDVSLPELNDAEKETQTAETPTYTTGTKKQSKDKGKPSEVNPAAEYAQAVKDGKLN